MHYATKQFLLPLLITQTLQHGCPYIDNLFAQSWKDMNMNRQIRNAGIFKRSGVRATVLEVGWREVDCDVLYDLLIREDVKWRLYNLKSLLQVYTRHRLDQSSLQVLVLDDSIKQCSGSKLEVVSRHFGHATI